MASGNTSEAILKFIDEFTKPFQRTMTGIANGTRTAKKQIKELNQMGVAMQKAGAVMFTANATAIGTSLKAAISYSDAIAKVKTIADESEKPINVLSNEMESMSIKYGQSISDVADSFYNVISATVDTAHAVDYVDIASKMAVGGFADMTTAVGGLTSAMASYGKLGYTSAQIGDLLAQTQVYGKTTINELSQALGTVLPFASSVGMSFEDLSTTMAVLTSNGLDTATATMSLKNAINSILKPTSSAIKSFESLGVAYGSGAFEKTDFGTYLSQLKDAVGLSGKAQESLNELMSNKDVSDEELTDFYNRAGINTDRLLTMFGNIRGATAMLSLTNSVDKYKDFRLKMNDSQGVLQKQANIMLDTPSMKLKQTGERTNALLVKFGEKLMPKFNSILDTADKALEKLNSMSDEQISDIVDNVIKITVASAGLVALGTIARAVSGILTCVMNISKFVGGAKAIGGKAVAGAKAMGSAVVGGAKGIWDTIAGAGIAKNLGVGGALVGVATTLTGSSRKHDEEEDRQIAYEKFNYNKLTEKEKKQSNFNPAKELTNSINNRNEMISKVYNINIDTVDLQGVKDSESLGERLIRIADNVRE